MTDQERWDARCAYDEVADGGRLARELAKRYQPRWPHEVRSKGERLARHVARCFDDELLQAAMKHIPADVRRAAVAHGGQQGFDWGLGAEAKGEAA